MSVILEPGVMLGFQARRQALEGAQSLQRLLQATIALGHREDSLTELLAALQEAMAVTSDLQKAMGTSMGAHNARQDDALLRVQTALAGAAENVSSHAALLASLRADLKLEHDEGASRDGTQDGRMAALEARCKALEDRMKAEEAATVALKASLNKVNLKLLLPII